MPERGVRLVRRIRLVLDPGATRECRLRPRIDDSSFPGAAADHQQHARRVAQPHEDVVRARRTVKEVELPEAPLLLLDDRQALARDDEEVLLGRLGVVHARRLAGLEHRERVADLGEHLRLDALPRCRDPAVGLELAAEAEGVVRDPRGIPGVDDEPARGDGSEPVADLLEARLPGHPRDDTLVL